MKKLISTLLLAVSFTFYGCPGEPVTPSDPQPNPILKENFHFRATLTSITNGTKVFDNEPFEFASYLGYASVASASGRSGLHEQSLILTRQGDTRLSGGVAFLKNFSPMPSDCGDIMQMFQMGGYPFGSRIQKRDGVVVYFIDEDGREWASDKGLGTQDSTANFKITSQIQNTKDTYSKSITEAEFTCKVYDDAGRSARLTFGSIKSRSVWCNN